MSNLETVVVLESAGTVVAGQRVVVQLVGVGLAGPRGDIGPQGPQGPAGSDATNYITSVFGRTGVITAQVGDYTAAQVGADPSGTAVAVVSAHAISPDAHGDRAYAQNIVESQSALDRQYTDASISSLISGAGPALDTLNELAAAIGDDPNFAGTVSLSLGYRLRFDTNAQSLSPTQQQNAWTNLGLGTVVTYNAVDFASSADFTSLFSAYNSHASNTSNPHATTAAQVGAAEKFPGTTTLSSSSGVVTIDASAAGDHYTLTLTENVTSWSFTSLPAANTYRDVFVHLVQHSGAAKTVASPATSGRTAGGAWVASTTLSSRETLGLRIFSDGTVSLFPSGVMG